MPKCWNGRRSGLKIRCVYRYYTRICRNGGMADAQDSKSCVGNYMWVQVPLSAPSKVPKFKRFRDFLFSIPPTNLF